MNNDPPDSNLDSPQIIIIIIIIIQSNFLPGQCEWGLVRFLEFLDSG